MNTFYLNLLVKIQNLMSREEGQDLVEYALIVSLISLGSMVAVKSVAPVITAAFNSIAANI